MELRGRTENCGTFPGRPGHMAGDRDPCGELLGSGAGALKPTVWTRNHVNLVNEVDQTNV